jgi:hypothetical protein
LKLLQLPCDRDGASYLDPVLSQVALHVSCFIFLEAPLVLIEPEDAGDHSRGVIDSKEDLLILVYLENYGPTDLDLLDQVGVSKDKKDLRVIFKVSPLVVVILLLDTARLNLDIFYLLLP